MRSALITADAAFVAGSWVFVWALCAAAAAADRERARHTIASDAALDALYGGPSLQRASLKGASK